MRLKRVPIKDIPEKTGFSLRNRSFFPWALFLGALLVTSVGAEEASGIEKSYRHSFSGRFALSLGQAREDLLLPIRQTGPAGLLGFSYSLNTERWSLETGLSGALFIGFDRYGTPNGAVDPAFQISWLHELPSPKWLDGLSIGLTLGLREVLGYYASWDDSHLYWLGSGYLGATARAVIRLGPRNLETTLSLPMVSLVSRPPQYRARKIDPVISPGYWLTRFTDGVALTSWHELQAFGFRAYWRTDENRWAFNPFAAVDFISYSEPMRATYLFYWLGIEVRG